MAKIAEKSPQIKSRQTKLSKKSNEELIEIILRKDKTEKNLNTVVTSLKGEVNELTNRLNNYNKDTNGTLKTLENLKDTNKTNRETIDNLRIKLEDKQSCYEKLNKYCIELENKCNSYKNVCRILIIIISVIIFGVICF